MDKIQLGTVGEWIAGIGALAAVIYALCVRGADARKAERARHRAQAELVGAWLSRDHRGVGWNMHVRNGGREPIYRWEASLSWVTVSEPGAAYRAESRTHDSANDGPLEPENTRVWSIAMPYPDHDRRSKIMLVMSFMDERGHLWKIEDGILEDLGRKRFEGFGVYFGRDDRIRAVQNGDQSLVD